MQGRIDRLNTNAHASRGSTLSGHKRKWRIMNDELLCCIPQGVTLCYCLCKCCCSLPLAGEGRRVPGGGLMVLLLPVQQHSVRFHVSLPLLPGHRDILASSFP